MERLRFLSLLFGVAAVLAVPIWGQKLPSNYLTGVVADADGAVWSWSSEGEPGAARVFLDKEEGTLRAQSIASTGKSAWIPSVPSFPRQMVDERLAGIARAFFSHAPCFIAYTGENVSFPIARGIGWFNPDFSDEPPELFPIRFAEEPDGSSDPIAIRTMETIGDSLWLSLGGGGVGLLTNLRKSPSLQTIAIDTAALRWSVVASCSGEAECRLASGAAVHTLRIDSASHRPAVETGGRMFVLSTGGVLSFVNDLPPLDQGESLWGGWKCGENRWQQTLRKKNGSVVTRLWNRSAGGVWKQVSRADWDTLSVLLHRVECIDNTGWGVFHSLASYRNGLLKLSGTDVELIEISGHRGIFSDITTLSGGENERWLVTASYGFGLALSADSGKTWSSVLNRTPVKGDLKEIRPIPSLLSRSDQSVHIAYRISERSKITIEVFSYDMRKIRTVVRGETRLGDPVRSSSADRDVWDGKSDEGRSVSSGVYYVRVKDDRGNEGWGKIYKSTGGER